MEEACVLFAADDNLEPTPKMTVKGLTRFDLWDAQMNRDFYWEKRVNISLLSQFFL